MWSAILLGALLWAQTGPFPSYVAAPRGWQGLEVGPVVVWYVRGQEGLARQVGLWAADAHREITGLLEFVPEGKFIVRLHPSPYAWGQQPPWEPQGSLVSPSRIIEVYPATTRAATAALVRSHLIAAILQHLYFSEGVRLQNRTLLYMPPWFLWGFAYFWGEGWTAEDITRLQVPPEKAFVAIYVRTARPSPLYRSLYKSLWYSLYRTYGQRKLIDLLYMARLTRSVSEAFSLTLNLSEEELTEKWRAFLQLLQSSTPEPSETGGFRRGVLSAAVAPDGVQRAYALWQKAYVRYYLETEEGTYELPGRWPWPETYYEPELPMAFSSQGQLAWVAYEMEGAVLWIWTPGASAYQRVSLGLRSVQAIFWQDERTLLLTGLNEEGQMPLYTLSLPQGALRKHSQVEGDLLFPAWIRGEYWAAWQPDTGRLAPLGVLWEPYRPMRYSAGRWVADTFPPFYGVGGGWIVADTQWATLSDVKAEGHPWIFRSDTMYPSGWSTTGLARWVGQSTERAYFLRYRGGRLRLGEVPLSALWQPGAVFPSLLSAEVVQLRLQRRAGYLTYYRSLSPSPPEVAPIDTSQSDTGRTQRAPFYLFDEEVSRPTRRRSRAFARQETLRTEKILPLPKPLGSVPYHWLLWELQTGPVLHPLMRLGWQVQAKARDPQADHEWAFAWTPYIDLRSSELQLRYTRYRSLWRPMVALTRQSHFFPARRYGRTLRVTTWHGQLGVCYSVSPFLSLELSALGMRADRYDMQLSDFQDVSAQATWIGAGTRLTYQWLSYREWMPWQGWQGSLHAEGYRQGTQWGFPLLSFRVERFQPLGRFAVLQLTGWGAAGGRRGRYFLLGGVPDWVNYEFQNRAQVPTLGDIGAYFLHTYVSLPGFPYQARRGRNLLHSSAVLRLPLLAWSPPAALPTRPIYGLEWQIGYYVATTWTQGNPFSQKNPIDAEYIFRPPLVISVQTLKSPFLMSVGTGVRFYIMRLPIGVSAYWPIEENRLGRARFIVGFQMER